jgi:hypothetical protein
MDLSTPANLLIAGIYYVIVGIMAFFSIFGVYILIRYGKSSSMALTVSLIYSFFFLVILASSYRTLQSIL